MSMRKNSRIYFAFNLKGRVAFPTGPDDTDKNILLSNGKYHSTGDVQRHLKNRNEMMLSYLNIKRLICFIAMGHANIEDKNGLKFDKR